VLPALDDCSRMAPLVLNKAGELTVTSPPVENEEVLPAGRDELTAHATCITEPTVRWSGTRRGRRRRASADHLKACELPDGVPEPPT
jgi:hypothetical protein